MTTFPLEYPLPWLWSCHHCHARYPLGTTRRCLHDGHYFCGGTTVSTLTGRTIKRHKACGSEFDYIGWEDVSRRRMNLGGGATGDGLKKRRGCENWCEYPSACHHRGHHLPVRSSSKASIEELFSASTVSAKPSTAASVADFESFLEPSFFETEPLPSAPEAVEANVLSALPIPKSTGLMIQKLIKATKRNSQTATLPSINGEDTAKNVLRPSRSAPPRPLSSSPPAQFTAAEPVGARASVKELGLIIPSLDFSQNLPSFFSPDSSSSSSSSDVSTSEEASSDTRCSSEEGEEEEEEEEEEGIFNFSTKTNNNPAILPQKRPLINLRLNDMDSPPDIDMTDYIPDSPTSPTSPGYPSIFATTTTITTVKDGAAAATTFGELLTPKSPPLDSPTSPLFLPL